MVDCFCIRCFQNKIIKNCSKKTCFYFNGCFMFYTCFCFRNISGGKSFCQLQLLESVFNYANFGEVNDILYGKESCMVIYTNQNSSGGHYIIPKTEKGYKIPNYFATKKVSNKFDKNGNFDVYNILGTQDYYMIGTIFSDTSEQNIVDNQNHPVENIIIDMGDTETKTVVIYSYVENFNSDYYLIINGIKTKIAE